PASFGDGFELPVDILRIPLLANAHSADYHDTMFGINAVNHSMVAELVLPIAGQRPSQRQAVSFGIDGELLLQDLSQLIPYTAVHPLYVCRRVSRVPKLKGRPVASLFRRRRRGRRLLSALPHLPTTSAVVSRRPAATSSSMVCD